MLLLQFGYDLLVGFLGQEDFRRKGGCKSYNPSRDRACLVLSRRVRNTRVDRPQAEVRVTSGGRYGGGGGDLYVCNLNCIPR